MSIKKKNKGIYSVIQILLLLFVFMPTLLHSQNYWTKVLGGNRRDDGRAVIEAYNNGFLFVCTTQSFGHGSVDIWLIKTNQLGDTVWTKTYGGNKIDAAQNPNCITRTNDNCYILVGGTNSFNEGNEDFDLYLIKIDSEGSVIWEKTYGTNLMEDGYSVINTKDDNFLVLGSKTSSLNDQDIWLLKLDPNGELIWDKTYGGPSYDYGNCLINDYGAGFLMGGSQINSGAYYIWLIKTDADGDTIWTKRFTEGIKNQHQEAVSIHLNDEEGYSVLCTIIDSLGLTYPYFFKTTSSGEITTMKSYKEQAEFNRIHISSGETTHDNGFILTGEKTMNLISNLILIKLDSDFNILWTRLSQNDNWLNWVRGWGVRESNDLGFIISAWFGDDAMLMKTDSVGYFIMPSYTEIVTENNNQFTFFLSQNYPNPFNPTTTIRYHLMSANHTTLKIYNLAGQEIAILVNEVQAAGEYEITWQPKELPSGLYFCKIQAGEFSKAKKLILQK